MLNILVTELWIDREIISSAWAAAAAMISCWNILKANLLEKSENLSKVYIYKLFSYVWIEPIHLVTRAESAALKMISDLDTAGSNECCLAIVKLRSNSARFPARVHFVKRRNIWSFSDILTFKDDLEPRSLANLRYQARSLLAQNGKKRFWHPLSCPRRSEPIMAWVLYWGGLRLEDQETFGIISCAGNFTINRKDNVTTALLLHNCITEGQGMKRRGAREATVMMRVFK